MTRARWLVPLVAIVALAALIVALGGGRARNRATAADVNSATLAPAPRGRLARLLKDATLVPEMSTATSRTYRRADGTFVSRVFARPPSYRDASGKERLIDPTLAAVSGGYATTGQGWNAVLPRTLATPIRIARGAGALSMQLEGAQGTGRADGTTMSYTNAVPGVDVEYHTSASTLSEDIKIDDPHAPARYAFALGASDGATAHRDDNGTITVTGRDGRTIATLAPSFALVGGTRDADAVRTDLQRVDGGWRVTLSVDPAWLAAAVRAHGTVTIDPTLELQDDAQDCALSSDAPTTSFCSASLWVGYDGDHDHHSLLKWDTSSIPQDAVALWGNVDLYHANVPDPDADKDLAVHRMRRDWTNDASWSRYDATHSWQTPGGDYDPDQSGIANVPNGFTGYVDFSITRLTQQWITRAVPNYGVAITDADGPRIAAEKDFSSTEDAEEITAPELDVAWAPRTGLLDAYTFTRQTVGNRADLAVNVANGNLALTTRDVSVAGVGGLDLEFDHYLNSLADGTVVDGMGVRGTGSLGRDLRLVEQQDDSVTFRRGDGVIEPFLDAHSSGGTTTYTTPDDLPGVTLTQDDAACTWTLDAKHGLPSLPGRHLVLTFASDGSLTSMADVSGHHLTFIYNPGGYTSPTALSGITDTHGDYYDVDRTATENETLDNIADPADAHHWTFTYDSSAHIRTETSVDGSIYTYTYDSSGRVTKVQAPDSSVALLTYDGTSRRVASIVRPSTPTGTTGPTTTYAYSAPTAPCEASVGDIGKVVVTQPDARVTTYCHDARDRVTYNDAPVAPVSGSSRLGLEKFWDYDSTDTGSGSQLMVNSDNGNLIWHDVPIVNPGRGLSTFVNVDYNSLERAPGLGVQGGIDPLASVSVRDRLLYNAAGRGISLSVSGPTRLNEPLGGVGLADVRDGLNGTVSGLPTGLGNDIALTDADGTTHHFTRDPDDDRKWIAPPGVHLTLRRWATTGDPIIDPAWVMTRADGVAYFFDRLGYLIKTQDRNGNHLTYTYEKYDLLTGASGSAATACGVSALLGSISGTPSAANGWGLQTAAGATVSAVAGKLCTLRLTKVTDPAGHDLTLSYKSRSSANQTQLDGDLSTALGGGSRTLASLLTRAASADLGIGLLMAPPQLATLTDHAGRQYTFDYTNGDLTSLVEVANAGTLAPAGDRARRWAFDYFAADDAVSSHRLRTVTEVRDTDEGGNRATAITYQTRTGTPPAGDTAALVPQRITDRNNNVTTYGFSAYGAATHELTVTDARSKTWTRDVDGYGRPTRITDPIGDATALRWDNGSPRRNDLLEVATGVRGSDPGAVKTMTYEPVSGRLASQTSYPDGTTNTDTARTTTLRYAISAGQSSLRPSGDPADGFVADLTEVDQPRVLQGGAHVGTKYTVDTATGNVTAVTDADGSDPTSATYCNGTDCPKGLVKSETDEVGDVTTYGDFDDNGMPKTMVDPKGNDIASGFPVPAAHPGSAHAAEHRWLYRYDAVGNLLSVSDPRNPDAQSAPSAATPNARFTTAFTYDAFDRVIQQVTPKDSANNRYITESWTYDRNGNQLTDTNAGTGRTTTATFSRTDQPLTVTQRAWSRTASGYASRDETTTFQYDPTDLLVARTDPLGRASIPATITTLHLPHTTEWRRDDAGRVVAEVVHAPGETPDRKIHSLALDPRGNVVGEIDAKRNADPDGNGNYSDARTEQAAIDATATAANLRFARVYDRADELTRQTEQPAPGDPSQTPKVDEYDYDADGNAVTHRLPRNFNDRPAGFSGDVADTYVYDHRDQIVQSVDPLGHRTVEQRRADGAVVSMTSPRGVTDGTGTRSTPYTYFTENYTYDAGGDLLTRTVPFAQGQYGRTDAEFAGWKVTYDRNAVGDAEHISDPRQRVMTNRFQDTGELVSTTRPSWWQLSWGDGGPAAGAPSLSERDTPLTDTDTPTAGHPSGQEHGKFGQVDANDPPSWLPKRGLTTFSYDDEGRVTSVLDVAGDRSRIDYDPAGRVVGTTQPFDIGAPSDRANDPANSGGTGAFPAGQRLIAQRYDYDLDGDVTTQRQLGNADWYTTNTYDGYDRLTTSEAPGSADTIGQSSHREPTTYTYDPNDNILTKGLPRQPDSVASSFVEHSLYDSLDRLLVQSNAAGEATGWRYDADDNVTAVTPPRGFTATAADQPNWKTLRTYDAADRLVQEQGAVVSDDTAGEMRPTSTYTYYDDDTLKQSREPGARRIFGGGDVTRVTDYDYDGRGNVDRKTSRPMDAGGAFLSGSRTSMWEFDPNGNLRRIVNPSGVDTTNGVVDGVPTRPKNLDDYASTSDPDGNIANATMGATLRQYDVDSPGGEDGLATAVWLPRSSSGDDRDKMDYTYDQRGRLQDATTAYTRGATVAHPHTGYDYFANGWIKGAKDFREGDTPNTTAIENRDAVYDYDEHGLQTLWRTSRYNATTATVGGKVTREFWPNGTLKSRVGRKVQVSTSGSDTDDTTTTRTYSYYYNGNHSLTAIRDVDNTGHDTVIVRDAAEREKSVNETWSTGKDSWFDYDAAGNVTSRKVDGHLTSTATGAMDDQTGSLRKYARFKYNRADEELTSATWEPTNVSPEPTADNCDLGASPGPPSGTRCVRSTYHPGGQRETRRNANNTLVSTLYDEYGEPSSRRRDPSAGSSYQIDYGYDARGNRTTDERGDYQYNARDQLTQWRRGGTVSRTGTVTYTMSPSGSVTHTVDTYHAAGGLGDTITDYTFSGEKLKKTVVSQSGASNSPLTSYYCYNDFGSVTSIQSAATCGAQNSNGGRASTPTCSALPDRADANTTYYCYDEFDRLLDTRGKGSDDHQVVTYDPLDRRDKKTLRPATGTDVTRDLSYVGTTPSMSRETTDDGGRNTFDYDGTGERLDVLEKAAGSSTVRTKVYAKDSNGSVMGLEGSDGTVGSGDRYTYDPFGELDTSGTGSGETPDSAGSADARANPFRFEGFYYDAAIKTYDMQARDYRPDVGRFLQQDTYEASNADLTLVGDPLTQNRYAFAGGNPVDNVEFDGHVCDDGPCSNQGGRAGLPHGHGNGGSQQQINQTENHYASQRNRGWSQYSNESERVRQAQDNALPRPPKPSYGVVPTDGEPVSPGSSTGGGGGGGGGWLGDPLKKLSDPLGRFLHTDPKDVNDAATGAVDATTDTADLFLYPRQTASAFVWSVNNPGAAASGAIHDCQARGPAGCLGYAATSALIGRGAGIGASRLAAAIRKARKGTRYARFSGTERPWTTGATPDSIYTQLAPNGAPVQNAVYDSNGDVIAHVDFKRHGEAPPGHAHVFPPGKPGLGHGPTAPHVDPSNVPDDWKQTP
ncbi:DNRLRE domain-containing protein [Conexibacter woesei]|uniref:DNRLRE domain-containing protein n=1 Tax=Conexibacter woesei TaxID=191495 RepID=UPI0018CAF9AB|nr:DNRLRE domain-containing protein [Conexibacter woesei]